MKVGRVAIITRGRYAGKKVRLQRIPCDRDAHELGYCEGTGRKNSYGKN